MANRKRKIVLRCPVTEQEQKQIYEKMKQVPTTNFSAFARKMLIDGYIIQIDRSDIKKQTYELQKIGNNINQIAKRMNSMGSLYEQDIQAIREALAEIWRLQRLSLLKAH